MSIGSVSSSDIRSLQDRFRQFQSGQTNLQKTDLTKLKDTLSSAGHPAAEDVGSVLQQFDRIDTNKDGMSIGELDAYSKSQGAQKSERKSESSRSITINISPVFLDGAQPSASNNASAGQGSQGAQESSGMSELESLLKSLDSNKDGKISLEELMSALKGSDSKAESAGRSGSKSESAQPEKPDLKKLLENAFAAAGKLQGREQPAKASADPGKAETPAAAGKGADSSNKNIGKYTMFSSSSISIQQTSLSVQYA